MIDTETYGTADLTHRDYDRIESSIVDLYAELNIKGFPIDPFSIAKQKGYEVIPYSQIAEEARKILRKTEKSGTSGRTKKGAIRLVSCSTGQHESGFAQNLANKMGVPVKAPTDTLWILPTGKMVIGKSQFSNTGKWKTYYPGGNKK
jgi:hypothetical protein